MPLRPTPTPLRRKAPRVAGAACVALLSIGVTIAPAVADDSRSYDFESLSAKEWPFRAINGDGGVTAAPAPMRAGTAARFNVPNDGHSFRSELALKGLDAGSHRFSFSNYLPGDWKEVSDDTIVAQWFSTQPDNEGVKPVISLAVQDGQWRLKVHWLKNPATFEEDQSVIPLGAVQFGHWNRWVLDITWSTPSTPGSVAVVRDGVQVGSHGGDNNYHRGEPPHFRIGIYRPAWRPEKEKHPTGGPDVVLFADDIAIAAGPAGPAAPAPAAPTAAPGTASTSTRSSASPSTPTPVPTGTPAPSPSPSSDEIDTATSGAKPSAEVVTTPTSTSELSATGSEALPVVIAGGTGAIVVGIFVLRRRRRRQHR
ncbi:polysaccharide lyase [Streptomyces sp. NBC_00424]|uniref:polysaccharide lyase n=1 Tax=Streptomyces sp. NBC_00424 TaxID=2903648 RepID=UPI00224E0181|nr:polysaccharide lyase [Streptomyces sp. NBC_00424]MCX5077640.1 polysaccharide lyase [Streptomyces sp. NBC_00424]MCX5078553.1 polysaccharide lyase [Streptomyces sp. NBC_00424]MCX5078899.1 polysaccharide lyase [Streptomyces sp. NBC_00424]